MSLPDLAEVAQLAGFLQSPVAPTDDAARMLLAVASGFIRRYTGQTLTLVTDDVELCDVAPNGRIWLKESPVVSVSSVETWDDSTGLWTVQGPETWRPTTGGIIRRWGTVWPSWPGYWEAESVRVTYTHGYEVVPDELAGVCCSIAARLYTAPAGVVNERLGQRSATYDSELSMSERLTLDSYRWVKFA